LPRKSISIAIVALNYTPEPTGIGPFAADLASGLSERGHRVRVITGYPHYPQWKAMGPCAEHDSASARAGIEIFRKRHLIPTRPSLINRSRMEASFGVRAAMAGHDDADLVFCISPPLLTTAAVVARERLRRRRVPVVVWVQDLYGLGVAETKGSESPVSRAALAFESRTFRGATALAVIHDRFKKHVIDDLEVDGANVAVFRNWSRQEPITLVERDEALHTLGWKSWTDHTIVLHAGNIGTKQGLENVVAAAGLADQTSAKVIFVLLGDGNQRPRLEKQAEGIESIRFIDVLDDVAFGHALRAANILLVNQEPAVSDMCVPSKLVSYYMAGRPVIAAVDPGGITADEVRNTGAGVVVPAGDPARLLDEVLALARDVDGSARMGRSGWEFIQQNFDRDATIDAMSDWLVDIAEQSDP
jgi:colanic acid biosynthesis glycosyl transferase WcaI